ncbi:hypothetical protein P9112_010556 [Eukaryota sp. TZLM1-RC]
MIQDCPDPGCRISQPHKSESQPRFRNPRNPAGRGIPTRNRNPQLYSIISSIQDGIKENHHIDHTYLSIYVTNSASSSESETSFNVTLNSLINTDNYSYHSSETILCSSSSLVSTPLSRVVKETILSDDNRPTSSSSETSFLVPLGKAPGSSNKSLSLETSPDLDSDLEPVYADCARHDGGVTELGNFVTRKGNFNHLDKLLKQHLKPVFPPLPIMALLLSIFQK